MPPLSYEGKTNELGYVAGLKDKMSTYADKLRLHTVVVVMYYMTFLYKVPKCASFVCNFMCTQIHSSTAKLWCRHLQQSVRYKVVKLKKWLNSNI